MKIINLASGSTGNLTYVEGEQTRILIDDGLSAKETDQRLSLLGLSGNQIDALLVTHEHVDHIKGAEVFSKKYDIPIYAHDQVWRTLWEKLPRVADKNKKIFDGAFELGDLFVEPFEVPHDVTCFGFSISQGDKRMSILTDLGHTTDQIFESVKGSKLIYLESNHDVSMLRNNVRYPLATKMRIAGKNGHLSNDDAEKFIEKLVQTGTKQIVLSHLSLENNSPEIAFNYITSLLEQHGLVEGEGFKIDVALTRPTTLFKLK